MKQQPLCLKALVIAMSTASLALPVAVYAKLDGAIFTTDLEGTVVNENVHYQFKVDVYLDGGPGPNAPASAAALPDGWYYFQVTDPSGKCLLSSTSDSASVNSNGSCGDDFIPEPLKCRLFHFDGENGITSANLPECPHKVNPADDGDVIQLFPFATTPNNGGVYKVWVSTKASVEEQCGGSVGDKTGLECGSFFGFKPSESKTDNFKVDKEETHEEPPKHFDIALRAFHDKNMDCKYDDGDEIINGWELGVTEPIDAQNNERKIYTTNASDANPFAFSILDKEQFTWSSDQFMWLAQANSLNAMNTPFTHFSTFAELKKFASSLNDADLTLANGDPTVPLRFSNAIACNGEDGENSVTNRATGEDTSSGETRGFTPKIYAAASEGTDPKLTIRFGSVGFASLKVCKNFDANVDGQPDEGTNGQIPNWPMQLRIPESVQIPIPFEDNPLVEGDEYDVLNARLHDAGILPVGEKLTPVDSNRMVSKTTGSDGCTTFHVLIPNVKGDKSQYQVSETLSNNWVNDPDATVSFDVESVLIAENGVERVEGRVINRSDEVTGNEVIFKNYCRVSVEFHTKGYWQNKNGLTRLTALNNSSTFTLLGSNADATYALYKTVSPYFERGDEPFDGKYKVKGSDQEVAAAFTGNGVWSKGTWQSEVSLFLTDSNAGSDANNHKEQLAQQLLAFIFNKLDAMDKGQMDKETQIKVGDKWQTMDRVIADAIAAWSGSNTKLITEMTALLDGFNNNGVELDKSDTLENCLRKYPISNQ